MPVIIPERDYDRWLKADPDRPPERLCRFSLSTLEPLPSQLHLMFLGSPFD
jgi:hypothetical protein